jgi:hypothetical protein
MALALNAVYVVHERRIRLVFSEALAAGAFTTLSCYTILDTDGSGVSPTINAAFPIVGDAQTVELALGTADLVPGGQYTVSAIGVPAILLAPTLPPSLLPFTMATDFTTVPNQEISPADMGTILYGRDLLWNGSDLQQDVTGDLATITGNQNVQQAIRRREVSDGLEWDMAYGAKPRGYVDGSSLEAMSLQTALVQQAVADPRVKKCTAAIQQDADETTVTFNVSITLIGDDVPVPVDVSVPVG